ncbi:MAG: hypothetical protein HZA04_10620 [Nitrospinae bacterium]|nr:hypothetical protein [Nitrospinota bacterium]
MAAFIRFLFLLFLVWMAWNVIKFVFRLVRGVFRFKIVVNRGGGGMGQQSRPRGPVAADMVRDPVCGAYVSVGHSISADFNGERQYFCSAKCRDDFRVKIGA